jgi:hypothetical protein
MNVDAVIARRGAERERLLARARRFAACLDPALGVLAVVVYGSVARGDFNCWSDIDVLVVAEHLPVGPLQRLERLGDPPAGVQPVAWTPAEWATQLARRNPIALEARSAGVWLVGSPATLPDQPGAPHTRAG